MTIVILREPSNMLNNNLKGIHTHRVTAILPVLASVPNNSSTNSAVSNNTDVVSVPGVDATWRCIEETASCRLTSVQDMLYIYGKILEFAEFRWEGGDTYD